jgi:hypothetical protein
VQEYNITATANGPSDWIRLDTRGQSIHLYHVLVDFQSEGSTLVDVEMSIERDFANATPICHDILRGVTANTASIIHAPIAGIRMNVSRYVGKTVTLKVLQS